ncbi:MAG: sporulation protein YabP [Clostridia bacterium]|nr:sporulation protein YabP [Clostridia bacterium]
MNSMPENQKNQTLILRDRKLLETDGVSDVVGFDEATVLLRTVRGAMTVEGEGLHITRLDLEKGVVSVEGNISAVLYTDESKGERRGFFARMVK